MRRAKRDYNFGSGPSILRSSRHQASTPWAAENHEGVRGDTGDFGPDLHSRTPPPEWNPGLYELTPAGPVRLRGKYVNGTNHSAKRASRAPIRGGGDGRSNKHARQKFCSFAGVFYCSVTAVACFGGVSAAKLSFKRTAGNREDVSPTAPLSGFAADFNTCRSRSLLQRRTRRKRTFLNSRAASLKSREVCPTRPAIERINLTIGPKTNRSGHPWSEGFAADLESHDQQACAGDPDIRKHYQFWF